jgi:hypothetical protein
MLIRIPKIQNPPSSETFKIQEPILTVGDNYGCTR